LSLPTSFGAYFSRIIFLKSELPRPWSSAAATRAKLLSIPDFRLHAGPKTRPAARRLPAKSGWSILPWVFQSAHLRFPPLQGRTAARPPIGQALSAPAASYSTAALPQSLTPLQAL